MFKTKDLLFISIISLILGYILAQQFFLQQKVTKATQPESSNAIALEVSEFIKNNAKLKKEKIKVDTELNKLSEAASSLEKTNEAIGENLTQDKIILGLVPVTGPGVVITFDKDVVTTQIIDLINAIKNIGAEAIAINNRRLGPSSTIEENTFYPPTIVKVIGDQNLLYDSLKRSGGIIDQIGVGSVEKNDTINLKSI